jgi:RNA polymerase sigma-70 factor (ECF subfamily)
MLIEPVAGGQRDQGLAQHVFMTAIYGFRAAPAGSLSRDLQLRASRIRSRQRMRISVTSLPTGSGHRSMFAGLFDLGHVVFRQHLSAGLPRGDTAFCTCSVDHYGVAGGARVSGGGWMAGATEWSPPVGVQPGWSLVVTAGLHSAMTAVADDLDVLIGAAVDGERQAVEGVLRWIRPLVVRYCRARVGGQEKTFASADDVAQEVCLAVLTALPSYRDQGRPFLAFVYGIAAHKVADAHRGSARNRSEPVSEVPDVQDLADGPEAQVMQVELAGRMARLLGMLPEKQREIIRLRIVVGLSAEQTAEAVGSTPGAVRVAQHRALSRLRSVVGSEGGGVR